MARKELVTKEMILQNAFDLAREEGIQNVTARKLATKMGCSTQPIFRVYQNMNELWEEVYHQAIEFFSCFSENFVVDVDTPFIHLGVSYIEFARAEKKLFELLFLSEYRNGRSLYELLNGKTGAISREINKAIAQGSENPSGLFMKMWIFIHGCACMVTTGDFDLTNDETVEFLQDIYKSCS